MDSDKWTRLIVALVSIVLVAIQKKLNLNLGPAEIASIGGIVAAFIIGHAHVDAAESKASGPQPVATQPDSGGGKP